MKKTAKYIITLLTAFAIGLALLYSPAVPAVKAEVTAKAAWNGDGTEEVPYQIGTAEDLMALAAYINGGKGSGRKDYFEQTADIDLAGYAWEPIGTSSLVFSGIYHGNRYAIRNLNAEGSSCLGLFGHIAGAEIYDVSVSGSIRVLEGTNLTGYRAVGGIVGLSEKSSSANTGAAVVSGCVSEVEITSAKTGNGGIAGRILSDTNVINCLNKGKLHLTTSANFYADGGDGGIVGYFGAHGKIEGCANLGSIQNKGTGDSSIGGILGKAGTSADVDITACYNRGDLSTAGSSQSVGIGGIIGSRTNWYDKNNTVTDPYSIDLFYCYNSGTVKADNKNGNAGGIIGYTLLADSYGDPVVSDENTAYVYSLKKAAPVLAAAENGGKVTGLSHADTFEDSADEDGGIPWLLSQLGYTQFKEDKNYINGGFPLLSWQEEGTPVAEDAGRVSFTLSYDTRANLSEEENPLIEIDGKQQEGNAFVLSAGEHSYRVSLRGYKTAEGTFTVAAGMTEVQTVSVKLTAETYAWKISVDPKEAAFVLKNEAGKTLEPQQADGVYTIALYNGTYSASASCEGYYDGNLNLAVAFEDGTQELTLNKIPETAPQEPEQDADGYYLITKPQELSWINVQATQTGEDEAVKMASANIRLMADLDMTGYDWFPMNGRENPKYIGNGYYSGGCYTGTFDGNGHTINNLVIDRTNTYIYYVARRVDAIGGLFGYTKFATIKNVGLTGSIRVTDAPDSAYGDYVQIGGLVGMAQACTEISGCFTDVTIQADAQGGYPEGSSAFIGGIAGSLTTGSVVTDSYSKGTLSGEGMHDVNIGGIAGSTRGDYHEYDDATNELIYTQHDQIIRCYSTASISADPLYAGYSYLGGIVGMVRGVSIGGIPEIYENFALNTELNGQNKCIANRILGNSYTFEDSGYYNYALSSMKIQQAEMEESESNYQSSYGLDITDAEARVETQYSNIGWQDAVWKLRVLDDYPRLAWEDAENHTHSYEPKDVIAPTCYEYGYSILRCKDCGVETTGNFTAPGAHQFSEWIESGERANSHEHVCVICGAKEVKTHTWDEGVVTAEATCDEPGEIRYTCTECDAVKTTVVKALGHVYEEPVWSWEGLEENGTVSAQAETVCSRCGQRFSFEAALDAQTQPADCETDGQRTYTAAVKLQDAVYTDTREVRLPALGHAYGAPEWSWSEDMKTATAHFICAHDASHVQSLEAVVAESSSPEDPENVSYTATVEWEGQTYTTETKANEEDPDAAYVFAGWRWEGSVDNGYRAAVLFADPEDPNQTKEIAAEVTVKQQTPAACETAGLCVYEAQAEFGGVLYTNVREVTVKAAGHDYKAVEWKWEKDLSRAEVTLVCQQDPSHTKTVKASVLRSLTKQATVSSQGSCTFTAEADLDGQVFTDTKTQVIPKLSVKKVTPTVTLSKKVYQYNGKAQKPKVTVKADGKTLSSDQYTVTYAKGRKNVGIYKVTVKLKGNYSGSKTVSFQIIPKKTSVKLTAGKNGFTVKWKKQIKQADGYQIQYSTNKNFKSKKTVTVKKAKTAAKKITKLKAKKTYYVRVRTYRAVNGKKYYSAWSQVKQVKTR